MPKRYPIRSIDSAVYRGSDDSETEVEVSVQGIVLPPFAGSMDEPPSGGEVEDVRAFVHDRKTGKRYEIDLTEDEVEGFSQQLAETAEDDYEPDDFDDRRLEIL